MENILTEISKLVEDDCKIAVHSRLTQNLVGNEKVILWNDEPLKINTELYNQFKEAIKRRGSKHYNRSDILPYWDFCISLLCSSGYSLNHTTLPTINDRTFTAAWRGLEIVSTTSCKEVSQWINLYMSDRTAEGYENTFNKNMELSNITFTTGKYDKILNNNKDSDILHNLLFNEQIQFITSGTEIYDTISLSDSTSTPEGQLDILRTINNVLLNL